MGTVTVGTDTAGSCTLGSTNVGVGMEAAAARAGRGSPADMATRPMHSRLRVRIHRGRAWASAIWASTRKRSVYLSVHRSMYWAKHWAKVRRQRVGRGARQAAKAGGAEKKNPPEPSPRTVVIVTLRGLFLHVAEPVGTAMVWRLSRRMESSV